VNNSGDQNYKKSDRNSLESIFIITTRIWLAPLSLLVVFGECHLTETRKPIDNLFRPARVCGGLRVIRSARDTHLVKIDCPSSSQSRKTGDWYSWNSISQVCAVQGWINTAAAGALDYLPPVYAAAAHQQQVWLPNMYIEHGLLPFHYSIKRDLINRAVWEETVIPPRGQTKKGRPSINKTLDWSNVYI
jgi:hypothetical protein